MAPHRVISQPAAGSHAASGRDQGQTAPAPAPEERKIVSVLFCDLVGFTAASDAADPEDVRARLRLYHQRLRQEIERYGATVEKFVADAVMSEPRLGLLLHRCETVGRGSGTQFLSARSRSLV